MTIPLTVIKKKKFVSCFDFYNAVSMDSRSYYRWVKKHILDNPCLKEDKDYIVRKSGHYGAGRPLTSYFLTIPVVISFCISLRTEVSAEIKRQLVT